VLIVITGIGVTDTLAIAVLMHPKVEPVTVYVLLDNGESNNVFDAVPLFQVYDAAPVAVKEAV
jgi:hypothetical protein